MLCFFRKVPSSVKFKLFFNCNFTKVKIYYKYRKSKFTKIYKSLVVNDVRIGCVLTSLQQMSQTYVLQLFARRRNSLQVAINTMLHYLFILYTVLTQYDFILTREIIRCVSLHDRRRRGIREKPEILDNLKILTLNAFQNIL